MTDIPNVRRGLSDLERSILQSELELLMKIDPAVTVAAVSGVDGFQIVHVARHPSLDTKKLAPMTSSLAALGSAVCRELNHRSLESVLVEGQSGRLLMTHIEIRGQTVILGIVTDKSTLLGKVFAIGAECVRRIKLRFTEREAR